MKIGLALIAGAFIGYALGVAYHSRQASAHQVVGKPVAGYNPAPLDFQQKCAIQGREIFNLAGLEKEQMAGFYSHYNLKLNRCVVLTQTTSTKVSPGSIWTMKTLYDAFEGTELGAFTSHTGKAKNYSDQSPDECQVIAPSGEKKTCGSAGEFDALVKANYMDQFPGPAPRADFK